MIRIAGIPITNGEAEWIADQLLKSRAPAAASALHEINAALENRHVIVDLDDDQRDVIIDSLEGRPAGLAELRGALMQEQVSRSPKIVD